MGHDFEGTLNEMAGELHSEPLGNAVGDPIVECLEPEFDRRLTWNYE